MSALSGIDIALWDLKGEFSFLLSFFTSCRDSIGLREHGLLMTWRRPEPQGARV